MDLKQTLLTSILRTVVPALVGLVISVPLLSGVDETSLEVVLTGAITGVFYAVFRVLEVKVAPWFGWALGKPSAPVYETTAVRRGPSAE